MVVEEAYAADLRAKVEAGGTGPLWGHETEDLDCTLLRWDAGGEIASHVNGEVDVIMTVLSGEGVVRVGEREFAVSAGMAVVIPKGLERSVSSRSDGFAYLNVHKRRRRLMPQLGGRPPR